MGGWRQNANSLQSGFAGRCADALRGPHVLDHECGWRHIIFMKLVTNGVSSRFRQWWQASCKRPDVRGHRDRAPGGVPEPKE